MKKVWMNISHFRFILYNLKIFGEIVTALAQYIKKNHRDFARNQTISKIQRQQY